jgi:hypothetical protein
MKICIVGAGASGLTCAFYLLQKGYKDITIIETSNRIGGKINSFKIDDLIYERGAVHLLNYYHTTFELLEKFGIKPIPVTSYHIVLNESIKKLFDFVTGSLNIVVDLTKYYHLTKQYNDTFLQVANFKNITSDPNLSVSVYDFLINHGLDSLIPFLGMMSMRLTSVDMKDLSFAVFIKIFPPNMLHAFINYNIPLIGHEIAEPSVNFIPGGYASLMDKMGEYLVNEGVIFEFGKRIQSIVGNEIISYEGKFKFDKLIMTSICKGVSKFDPVYIDGLPCMDLLHSSKIYNPCVFKQHVRSDEVNYGDYILMESAINKPYSVYNFYKDTKILGTLSVVDTKDRDMIRGNIINSLTKEFGNLEIVEEDIGYFCYLQPVISVTDVKNGFYDKIESYQGTNNIYYSNIFFTMSYSGLVMQYAREMIDEYF